MTSPSASSPSVAAAERQEEGISDSSRLFLSPSRRTLLLCLLLTLAVLASYNGVTHNAFLNYDDDRYITDNPHINAGLTTATVKWAFTTYDQDNWHPLTWLSHALDRRLFGLNPVGHHYVNVLLHAANAVVLFLLLQNATGFSWRSLMVAALFALHPINVESVAWAAERKNGLSMLFFLLALYAYGWYATCPAFRRYVTVAVFFALALLSKPQVIAFPFLLLLWDYWPLGRIGTRGRASSVEARRHLPKLSVAWLALEKVPLVLLSAASAVVTMKAQNAGGAVKTLSQYTVLSRLETAVISYVEYLGKAFWPSRLAALYPHSTGLYPAWQVGSAALFLIVISVWVVGARAQRRYLVVGWFWFLGSLVPMIGLVQVGFQAMADRYAYIPFIGLFLMVTWLISDWAVRRQISVRRLAIPAASCLLVLGVLTYRQVGYWRNTPSFWLHTLAVTQNNYIAHDMLGDFLAREGRTEEAAAHFHAALAIRPDDLAANLNLGNYESDHGNLPEAIERYQMVARSTNNTGLRASAYGKLGFAYRRMGELIEAKQYFEMALQLAPDHFMAMIGLGLIAQKNGDLPEAVRQYSLAVAVQPTDVGFLLLAQAMQQAGRSDEANSISEHAARVSPNLVEAQKKMQSLLSLE
jgi:tetratricopeptide (TPR) repeat protein